MAQFYSYPLGTVSSLEWKPIRLTACSNGMVFRSSTEIKPYGLYILFWAMSLRTENIPSDGFSGFKSFPIICSLYFYRVRKVSRVQMRPFKVYV